MLPTDIAKRVEEGSSSNWSGKRPTGLGKHILILSLSMVCLSWQHMDLARLLKTGTQSRIFDQTNRRWKYHSATKGVVPWGVREHPMI